jgi:mannose-1-phosphate guanylyltransferase/mannose-6-phosphate isomerase
MVIRPAIMCGGSGTRLWPMSRQASPKQLLALVGDQTMLAQTALRLEGLADASAPIVLTSAAYANEALAQIADVNGQGCIAIVEPDGRNTAPAAAMAALQAMHDDPDALVLLMASDHHVRDPAAFHRAVLAGAPLAAEGALVTFGIKPDHPETGYGYIQRGAVRGGGFQVKAFKEKPDFETAQHYVATGNYDWNAGIFLFSAKAFLATMGQTAPAMLAQIEAAWAGRQTNGAHVLPDAQAWDQIEGDSIDYAVAERASDVVVVPVDMGWSDVGSFAALWDISQRDANSNSVKGDATIVDCRRSLVRANGRHVAVVGLDDVVVIETADAILIAHRDKVQDVKTVVANLKAAGRGELL